VPNKSNELDGRIDSTTSHGGEGEGGGGEGEGGGGEGEGGGGEGKGGGDDNGGGGDVDDDPNVIGHSCIATMSCDARPL